MYFFSSCGKTKNIGPTQDEANTYYKGTNVSVEIVGQGIQKWIVPETMNYRIEAAGASGVGSYLGNKQGYGARIASKIFLQKGDVLYIVIGQQGYSPHPTWGGAGGGGTFIVKEVGESPYLYTITSSYVTPLLIAPGGGGGGDNNHDAPDEEGGDGLCTIGNNNGGSNIDGYASGGAGFSQDSKNGKTKSFLMGSVAGSYSGGNGFTSYGGFGGGGNSNDSAGGGGGFSGGDSTEKGGKGFGGTSFSINPIISCFKHEGSGFAIFSPEPTGIIQFTCVESLNQSFFLLFILVLLI